MTIQSSAMLPSGLVIMREVKPAPGAVVLVFTSLAAKRRTLDAVVVSVPLLEVALEPDEPMAACNGLTGSSPWYSRIRTSGKVAAAVKPTVTVLAPAPMFLA